MCLATIFSRDELCIKSIDLVFWIEEKANLVCNNHVQEIEYVLFAKYQQRINGRRNFIIPLDLF